MKKYYIITLVLCLLVLFSSSLYYGLWTSASEEPVLKVGFLYENDESNPYSYNFYLAQSALEKEYGERVSILARSNVQVNETAEPLSELVKGGCRIIFTNTHSDQVVLAAEEHPDVQFCQISCSTDAEGSGPDNYHTFNGKLYQGMYVNGIVAGMKLRELLDSGRLLPEEALVGFVGSYESPQVISSFTAFLLGVRTRAPEAAMRVRYTGTWSSFSHERDCARQLIEEGCVIIAQHSNTIGPAAACEDSGGRAYHVGYNQSMLDVAPSSSLISTRVNWSPYIIGAVEAILDRRPIEKQVVGEVHGRDINAGFDRGWVEMLELNEHIASPGTDAAVVQAIEDFRQGKTEVFKGDYVGVNPQDPRDTIDLRGGYTENRDSSLPSFHYILQDVIIVEA